MKKGKTRFQPTTELKNLQYFFMQEYLVKGEKGLPMFVIDGEQNKSPTDFAAMVMEQYANKPNDYELHIGDKFRVTAEARKRRAYRSPWEVDTQDSSDSSTEGSVAGVPAKRPRATSCKGQKRARKSVIVQTAVKTPLRDTDSSQDDCTGPTNEERTEKMQPDTTKE